MNTNENKSESASQKAAILKHLQAKKTITSLEALQKFGCLRLGARIFDLRDDGHRIKTEMITVSKAKRVARYTLI